VRDIYALCLCGTSLYSHLIAPPFISFPVSLSNSLPVPLFLFPANHALPPSFFPTSSHHTTPQQMHFFPMAMYTHTLVPPPKEVSTELGETRSAKRGAVSVDILDETDGLGGLKDK
jgi:hypothetical protein